MSRDWNVAQQLMRQENEGPVPQLVKRPHDQTRDERTSTGRQELRQDKAPPPEFLHRCEEKDDPKRGQHRAEGPERSKGGSSRNAEPIGDSQRYQALECGKPECHEVPGGVAPPFPQPPHESANPKLSRRESCHHESSDG